MALWHAEGELDRATRRLQAAGATKVVTTIDDAVNALASAAEAEAPVAAGAEHAADVHAGAAEMMALDHRGVQALLAAARGDGGARLTGTDDDGVESLDRHGGLPGCVDRGD